MKLKINNTANIFVNATYPFLLVDRVWLCSVYSIRGSRFLGFFIISLSFKKI
jgi:hypothetical protein